MQSVIPKFEKPSKIGRYSREVLRLQREIGRELKPVELVHEAKRRTSPLHKYFDWSDTAAARKWRIHQARILICNVRVLVINDKGRRVASRALWSVRVQRGEKISRGYLGIEEVRTEPSLRVQILNEAVDDLEEWLRRYAAYGEFSAFRVFLKAKVAELRATVNGDGGERKIAK